MHRGNREGYIRPHNLRIALVNVVSMVIAIVLGVSCAPDTQNTLCEGPNGVLLCPPGWRCSGDRTACVQTCGDGVLGDGEECDDGNTRDGDGCDSNCTVSGCGNGIWARNGEAIEMCDWSDPASPPCSMVCTTQNCGNGIIEPDEECDVGSLNSDEKFCTTNCRIARCGDSKAYVGYEECDDGNSIDGDGCDHDCTESKCGNGITAGVEECDDGMMNSNNGNCRDGCKRAVCGDGYLRTTVLDGNPPEVCDDHNISCGACQDCSKLTYSKATGFINVFSSSNIVDGHTFTLNDGLNHQMIFEFDDNGASTPGNYVINIGTANVRKSEPEIRDAIAVAIARSSVERSLEIRAFLSDIPSVVNLEHKRFTSYGNRDITPLSRPGLSIFGMVGGSGGNCGGGEFCRIDQDCLANICLSDGTCKP